MSTSAQPGVILIDKEPGRTSFSVVRAARRVFGLKKVGHAGTLDPFASGLLVVCLGRPATRLIEALMAGDKTYLATVALGRVSTTLDPEGEISPGGPLDDLDSGLVERTLAGFRGRILQQPPRFSALKHQGKPLYYYARKGIDIVKEPREVVIHQLQLHGGGLVLDRDNPVLELLVRCSKGTYIRSLAGDIGAALGCGAYLAALRRTGSGCFMVADSVPGAWLDEAGEAERVRERRIPLEEIEKMLQSF